MIEEHVTEVNDVRKENYQAVIKTDVQTRTNVGEHVTFADVVKRGITKRTAPSH